MRVALVGEYPLREDAIHAGGIQSVTHGLAHALARRDDVECHVICAAAGARERERRVGRLAVHFVPRPPLPYLATCRLHDVPRLIARIRALDPDIVHGQGQDRHGLAAVRCRRPAVVTPHGVLFLESRLLRRHALDAPGALKKHLLDHTEREVFRHAGDMIVISRYLPEVYGPLLGAHAHFIENPIDPAFFDLERAPEAGRLLFAGTIVPRKRVPDLVAALAGARERAPGLRLRIAGPLSDPAEAARVRERIAALGLSAHASLTGPLSQEELFDEYRRAELLVLSSREETAPQVIAQAMACGLPVVAADAAGVPYMVRDGETARLFPAGDAEACARCLVSLHGDADQRGRLAAEGRVQARRRFHPDAVAEQTVAVYRQVLARAGSTPR
ncbi:MAG: glycosyltransferase family 4 protein [Candidatus Eisenbacteria bacterium]|uniref:Glycosyltransferase family 4 protein n=1 Tax=Eiseniibacteriota bacterium TaxID=2212470 RepID=A0A937X9E4_UNCEI|nr:glycosyltransferase family 4 protein [Candidatus Eisenbacteria bacterium]